MHRAAKRLVRRAYARGEIAEDVADEAILFWAKNLEHAADLHVNCNCPRSTFTDWLATIIQQQCGQVAEAVAHGDAMSPLNEHRSSWQMARVESIVDLRMAIDRLPPPMRTFVQSQRYGLA